MVWILTMVTGHATVAEVWLPAVSQARQPVGPAEIGPEAENLGWEIIEAALTATSLSVGRGCGRRTGRGNGAEVTFRRLIATQ